MLLPLFFGGVELWYSKRECLRFFIQACFCPWLHSSYRSNAVLLVVDTLKIGQRNGQPKADGEENFPVETSVFATKRSLADSRACRA
jgi:hypothetical protein